MSGMPMKRTAAFALLGFTVLAVFALGAGPSGQKEEKPKLPDRYRAWLEEEVVYIVAPMERDVFLKLQSDRERDLFIEAFWKQRDPNTGTPENEFKTEHARRIAHANRYLGRDAPKPGWKTDRGRMYIILGEPRDIQRFEGKSSTYDAEIWFYQGLTDLGLPAAFNLVFFREYGRGEYRLYSPAGDGPQALLTGYTNTTDYMAAYEKLREFEPELAAVSLSLIPGETQANYGRPSMGSDILIQRVESSAARNVESKYARKFLQYKDLVEVEYTANYLESDSLIKVFRDPSGMYFVHYAVEPRRLSLNLYEGEYSTTLKVNGRLTTPDGRLVHQFDKTVALKLTEEQAREASRSPFDFQDLFPLLGGDYELSVLIKNEASKEFTSVESALRIPQPGASVELTQPLLGYRAARLEPAARRMKAFRVGPYQIYCQPGRVFARKETLAVVFQLNNPAPGLADSGEVRIAFLKDGQTFREIRRKPSDYPELPVVLEEVSLADFPPAHYTVRVSVESGGRRDRFVRRGVRPELRRGRPAALVLVAHPAQRRGPLLRGDRGLPALQRRPLRRSPRVPDAGARAEAGFGGDGREPGQGPSGPRRRALRGQAARSLRRSRPDRQVRDVRARRRSPRAHRRVRPGPRARRQGRRALRHQRLAHEPDGRVLPGPGQGPGGPGGLREIARAEPRSARRPRQDRRDQEAEVTFERRRR